MIFSKNPNTDLNILTEQQVAPMNANFIDVLQFNMYQPVPNGP